MRRHSGPSKRGPVGVRVVSRVRPLLPAERTRGDATCVELGKDKESKFIRINSERYDLDDVYSARTTQEKLFKKEVKPFLPRLVEGHSTTVFAFGMTGTGKSFTMNGTESQPGLVPRSAEALFQLADERGLEGAQVTVTFLEIYKERVFDLLAPRSAGDKRVDLPVRESRDGDVVVANLSEVVVGSPGHFREVYARGMAARKTFATKLNKQSSRSHSMLTLKLVHTVEDRTGMPVRLTGKLRLLDLAGNEDNRRTGNRGARMAESGAINKSLFVLGQVLTALQRGDRRIPFRDSKLTRLLQRSLGGNNYALMICNVAPSDRFVLFTQRTLAYGLLGRQVKNMPTVDAQEMLSEADMLSRLDAWRKAKAKGKAGEKRSAKTAAAAAAASATAGGSGRRLQKQPPLDKAVKARKRVRTPLAPIQDRANAVRQKTEPGAGKPEKPLSPTVRRLSPEMLVQLVNTQDYKALTKLHTIGPKRARAIVEQRELAPFTGLADLRRAGLGDKQIAKFQERNSVMMVA